MHFLQKFTNPSIAVSPVKHMICPQSFLCNGTICSGMTDNLNLVRKNTNLYWLADIIALVVYGVAEALLYSRIWIIEETFCLCLIRQLLVQP